jgi:hypothetical protein
MYLCVFILNFCGKKFGHLIINALYASFTFNDHVYSTFKYTVSDVTFNEIHHNRIKTTKNKFET